MGSYSFCFLTSDHFICGCEKKERCSLVPPIPSIGLENMVYPLTRRCLFSGTGTNFWVSVWTSFCRFDNTDCTHRATLILPILGAGSKPRLGLCCEWTHPFQLSNMRRVFIKALRRSCHHMVVFGWFEQIYGSATLVVFSVSLCIGFALLALLFKGSHFFLLSIDVSSSLKTHWCLLPNQLICFSGRNWKKTWRSRRMFPRKKQQLCEMHLAFASVLLSLISVPPVHEMVACSCPKNVATITEPRGRPQGSKVSSNSKDTLFKTLMYRLLVWMEQSHWPRFVCPGLPWWLNPWAQF